MDGKDLPLVAMMDFVNDVQLEQSILEGVARVVPYMLDKSKPFSEDTNQEVAQFISHLPISLILACHCQGCVSLAFVGL